MPLDLSILLPNKHPDNLIYIRYCSTWKFLILWGVLENKKTVFNELFGCPKAYFDHEWWARLKKLNA